MNTSLIAIIGISAFILGQWLVTRKHWSGFLVWAASNLLVAGACVAQGNHPTAFMFGVYFLANLYSMVAWSGPLRPQPPGWPGHPGLGQE